MFSHTFKAFVMFMTSLPCQSNFDTVLAHEIGPKNSVDGDLSKTKKPKKNLPDPQLCFMLLTVHE